jgi:pimeloyl-ACP methyl ester carboxylesterase
MSTYLLIHGAWHGGWCWRKVVPLLEAKGHRVLAPDLPGNGDDKTPASEVTLKSYADSICKIASAQPESVILVGHSMGGVAITEAAESCPDKVAALVYMCAFLPRNGDSLATWATQDLESMVNPSTVEVRPEGAAAGFKREYARRAFTMNCSEEDAAFAESRMCDQAIAPFAAPVKTTPERWGRVPRYYIECTSDRAITPKLQQEMQKHSPCRKTFSIETDHSPFLSAPEQLADILTEISTLQDIELQVRKL